MNNKINLILNIDEEQSLSSLMSLFKKCPKNVDLYLDIHWNWGHLHSIQWIKEIKKHSKDFNLFVNTHDELGKKMLNSANINLYDKAPINIKPFLLEITPNKKFSTNKIWDAFKNQDFEVIKIIKQTSEEQAEKAYISFKELSLKNKILIWFASIFAIWILTLLIALILPSANVKITSEKKIIDIVANINFIKSKNNLENIKEDQGNNVNLYPIDFIFEDNFDFPVLSKIFEWQHSEGQITMYNNYTESISLKDWTRIQTTNGLFFTTKHYVRISWVQRVKNKNWKTVLQPGSAKVDIIAEDLDLYQNIIWSRGNIKEKNKFIVPWLTSYMQKFIWWENETSLSWGITRWRKEVRETDVDAAKEKMNITLLNQAKEKIKNYITDFNLTHKKIALFPVKNFIIKEVVQMKVPDDVIGKSDDYFNINGKMLIKAYVFYEDHFYKFLKNEFKRKEDPNMHIEKILFDNMIFRKYAETYSEIRVTCSLQWRQSYNLDEESKDGKIFQAQLKEHIAWFKIEDAQKYIQNKREINDVKIKLWPPIKKHLPMVKENIKIIVD